MKAIISARFLASKAAQPGDKPFEVTDTRLVGFMLRVQPSGYRSYYARITSTRRVSLGSESELTPDEARERCEMVLGNVAHGRPPKHGLPGEATGPTLASFVTETYEPRLRATRPDSADKTLQRLKRCFGDWYDTPLDGITVDLVETWRTKRLTDPHKPARPATVLRDVMTLSGVLARAVKAGKLAENVIERTESLKIDRTPKVRFLDREEEGRLRAALTARDEQIRAARDSANRWRAARDKKQMPAISGYGDHLTPAVLLSMNTGARRGELLRLTWENVDLAGKTVTLVGTTTKNAQTRHVPLNAEALAVLKRWQKQAGSAGRVFDVDTGFKTAWKQLLKRARITKFRWHDLRHHFASRLAQAGVPLNTIRELMGHGSLAMVLRYAHLAPDQKREAVELLTSGGTAAPSPEART